MLPNREGSFNALPLTMGIDETGDNNLATVQINFAVIEEVGAGGPVDCSGENLSIVGYFYLEKKDGQPNDKTIASLKESLGWDGLDLEWFNTADVSQKPVQIVLGFEEYQGKNRIRVQFLNPYGSTGRGTVTRADSATLKVMSGRLGAKLRAMSGGTPHQTAKPTAARPTAARPSAPSKAPTVATATATKPAPAPCSADDAWAVFVPAAQALGMNEAQTTECWFKVLGELFPSKQPDQITPAEWGISARPPAPMQRGADRRFTVWENWSNCTATAATS